MATKKTTKKTVKKTTVAKKAVETVKKVVKMPATVLEGKRVVRTYDFETHGENYWALAEQFAAQYPDYIVK